MYIFEFVFVILPVFAVCCALVSAPSVDCTHLPSDKEGGGDLWLRKDVRGNDKDRDDDHGGDGDCDGDFKSFQYQCYTSHIGSLLQYQCNRGNRAIWQFDEAYRRPIGTFFVFTILRPKMQNGWSKIFEDNTTKFKLMQEEASLEKCSRRRFDGNISASAAHF